MKTLFTIPLLIVAVGLTVTVEAADRVDHYAGAAAETLEQALANFAETNARVAKILAQNEVTLIDMAEIHELTYTLENALERIDDEYDQLEDQLEQLHLASEGANIEHARVLGQTYLENAGRFPE